MKTGTTGMPRGAKTCNPATWGSSQVKYMTACPPACAKETAGRESQQTAKPSHSNVCNIVELKVERTAALRLVATHLLSTAVPPAVLQHPARDLGIDAAAGRDLERVVARHAEAAVAVADGLAPERRLAAVVLSPRRREVLRRCLLH